MTTTYVPGDILLVNDYTGSSDLIGNLIRAGERARYGDTDVARWTHCALIVSSNGDIVEALSEGVRLTNISKYGAVETKVIEYPAMYARPYACKFAKAHVGTDYDYLDFGTLALTMLTGCNLSLHSDSRFICSGLVARATECYTDHGYPYPYEQMMPADLAFFWGAHSGEPPAPISFMGRVLDKFKAVVRAIL